NLVWPSDSVPFTDVDSASLKVTLAVTDGTIAAAAAAGITVGGTATARTVSGSPAALNAYFKTAGAVTYLPAPNNTNARVLTTTVTDGALSRSASSTIGIIPNNDAPTVSAPASFTVTEDVRGNLVWPAASTPFADADTTVLQVTLSIADGAIAAASAPGITVGGTATARTVSGSAAALNAYFKTVGRIGYTTAPNNTVARTLTTTVSDGLLSASALSTIAIKPVNDAPVIAPAATVAGTAGVPREITYAELVSAAGVSDVDTALPSLRIVSVQSGKLERWNGQAWVVVSTAAAAPVAQRTLSAGQKLRWTPVAGATGVQPAFRVAAFDGVVQSTGVCQVAVGLASAS
ncbi:MAG: hypothetical protein ACKOHG_14330, partial [Planctomycetia bacterium]